MVIDGYRWLFMVINVYLNSAWISRFKKILAAMQNFMSTGW